MLRGEDDVSRVQELVGREAQLEAIAAWLGDTERLPGTILLQGEPGIGKTSLVRATADEAQRSGMCVLRAAPVEPEAGLPYAALGDLLGDRLGTFLAALPVPQQRALETALLLRPAAGHPLESLAVATAFLNALRLLSAGRPVLLLIDDAQWLDGATVDVVRFALRRLRREHVAAFVARRPEALSRGGLMATDLAEPTMLQLKPLPADAIHALVRARTGMVLSRPVLSRVHELSAGNPLYALELARALRDGRLQLRPGETLPSDLRALVGGRIGELPPDTREALGACAVMSRPSLDVLGRTFALADPETVVAPAVAAGVVDLDSGVVTFRHPLLASAAYAALTVAERVDIHGRLARVVPDRIEQVRHLALATQGPDERVAMEVEMAATDALQRAAAADAADLASLARRLTPDDETAGAHRRTFLEAHCRFESGESDVSAALLEWLIERTAPGPARARVMAALARVRHFQVDVGAGVTLQRQALAEVGSDDQLRGALEESIAEGLLLTHVDLEDAARHARSAAAIAATRDDPAALGEALAAVALVGQSTGSPVPAAMARALELEPALAESCVMRQPSFAFGAILAADDELERARSVFRELLHRADERGNVTSIAPLRNRLSTVVCLMGDYAEAERLARAADEFALQAGQVPSRASALGRLALVLARRGELASARDAAERSLLLAAGPDFTPGQPAAALTRGGEHALWAMGEIAAALGDAAATARHLGPLATTLLDAGVRDPGELRYLVTAVEAHLLLGHVDAAARLGVWLEREAERVPRPSVTSAALASRGLLDAARGDLGAAVDHLDAAVDEARRAPLPYELGQLSLLLGKVQRRATRKRAARTILLEAHELFVRLGARRWAENTHRELARIGGRAPAQGTLSESEQRVAGLVTQGLSNKEVAAALFVTPKAVEASLSRVYAKTGARSRTQLTALMVTGRHEAREATDPVVSLRHLT